MKVDWYQLEESERRHLIESEILGYQIDALSDIYVFHILKNFNAYQITKQYPLKYRTIVGINKNAALADTLIDSVCLAALKSKGIVD